ncbi:MAG: hypothetical protein ABIO63_11360 [Casimicrobiaceae bacterium]
MKFRDDGPKAIGGYIGTALAGEPGRLKRIDFLTSVAPVLWQRTPPPTLSVVLAFMQQRTQLAQPVRTA